jgi:hypothetical protein
MEIEEFDYVFTKHLFKEFAAGGIAGSIGIFIGFPFDLIKVRFFFNDLCIL